jgi:hypothetical protein
LGVFPLLTRSPGREGGPAGWPVCLPSLVLRGGNVSSTHTGTPAETYQSSALVKDRGPPNFPPGDRVAARRPPGRKSAPPRPQGGAAQALRP